MVPVQTSQKTACSLFQSEQALYTMTLDNLYFSLHMWLYLLCKHPSEDLLNYLLYYSKKEEEYIPYET